MSWPACQYRHSGIFELIDISATCGLKAFLKQQHFSLPIESGLVAGAAPVDCRYIVDHFWPPQLAIFNFGNRKSAPWRLRLDADEVEGFSESGAVSGTGSTETASD